MDVLAKALTNELLEGFSQNTIDDISESMTSITDNISPPTNTVPSAADLISRGHALWPMYGLCETEVVCIHYTTYIPTILTLLPANEKELYIHEHYVHSTLAN